MTGSIPRVCAGLLLLVAPSIVLAEGSVTVIAPAAPGGGWDQTARVIQHVLTALEPDLSVQVENVPGAAGTIGLARFVSAERGNPNALLVTGLVMLSGIVMNGSPITLAKTTPIARLTGEYEVIVVPVESPLRTLGDLLDLFKRSPAAVSWGGGSAGGTDDLLVRLLSESVGVPPSQANYVAFPGGGAALAAMLGGQLTAGVSGYSEFASQIQSGKLRALAVSAPARLPSIDVPTLRESGVPVDLANWRAVVGPPGLTDAERDRWTQRIERMVASREWHQALARYGWSNLLLTGPAFRQFLLAEHSRIESVLGRLNATAGPSSRGSSFALTPRTVPLAVLFTLGVLATATIAATVIGPVRARYSGRARRDNGNAPQLRRAITLALALIGQALMMPVIGFVPATALIFTITARALGSRAWLRDLGIGLAVTSVLYVTFTQLLGLSLPPDPVTRRWGP
jgi:putative tricarboxylic transport membrane protein